MNSEGAPSKRERRTSLMIVIAVGILTAALWAGVGPFQEFGLIVWALGAAICAILIIPAVAHMRADRKAERERAAHAPQHEVEPQLTPEEAEDLRAYMRLAENWKNIALNCGLAVRDAEETQKLRDVESNDRGGVVSAVAAVGVTGVMKRGIDDTPHLARDAQTVYRIPVLGSVAKTKVGPQIMTAPAPGQTVEDLANAAPAIANACLVSEVVVGQEDGDAANGVVRLTLRVRDPLTGIREARVLGSPELVVGRSELGEDAAIDIRDAAHIAIQGMTRSGKSATCYTLLSQAMYLPEVRIMGADPNRVLLSPIAKQKPDDIALGDDIEKSMGVLDRVYDEMTRRMNLIDERGIEKIDIFSPDEPVVLVVLEEYDALLKNAAEHDQANGARGQDKIHPRMKARVGALVAQGAKAGIRVLLITQRMDAEIVAGATRGQFGTRLTFAVDNGDAVRMLHPQTTPEAIEKIIHFPPGRCLMWQHRKEQVVQADLTKYDVYRAEVEKAQKGSLA